MRNGYGAIAPALVNVADRIARELGHINGYAEGTDGAVFIKMFCKERIW